MKKSMSRKISTLLLILMVGVAYSKGTPPPPVQGPPGMPIDTAIMILAALGAGYGIRKKKN